MWKQKIGISIGNNYTVPAANVVKMLRTIGFDAISPEWKTGDDLFELVRSANECGMFIQSLHAPYGKAADMWSDDSALCECAKNEILLALDSCVQCNVPVLVVHAWKGFDYEFNAEALNYKAFDEIVAYAKERNIKIAFENTEGEEFLFALMEHFKNNNAVGFCWDSGHELCYNHSQDLLEKFGDRLIMTHLNDNLGISRFDGKTFWTDDLHLLPFDGIADWDYNVERLKKSKHMDVLNFELKIDSKPNRHENDIYKQMSLENYFTQAYQRACKIAYRYSEQQKA